MTDTPIHTIDASRADARTPSRLASLPVHVALIALFPALSLFQRNIGSTTPAQLVRPMAFAVLSAVALFCTLRLINKNTAKAAAISSLIVLLFFGYGHLENLVALGWNDLSNGRPAARLAFLGMWIVLTSVAVAVLSRLRVAPHKLTGLFNVAGLALVGMSAFGSYSAWSGMTEVQAEARSQAGAQPIGSYGSGMPDVFYIVMDGYGRSDALRKVIGVDNRPFIEELRKRGFYVADQARSNYTQTELSLASSLNMKPVQELFAQAPPANKTRRALDVLIDYNEVGERFRQRGYIYAFVSTGFPFLTGGGADIRTLGNVRGLSLFESSLILLTPISLLNLSTSAAEDKRNLILSAFDAIKRFAEPGPRPRFVFAHILMPHPPFVFRQDGSFRKPESEIIFDGDMFMEHGGTPSGYREGYAGQLLYANKLILEAIDKIRARSKTPPLIIIQGDHGSKVEHNYGSLQETNTDEVLPILNAYLAPQPVVSKLYPSITPVNSFRVVLSALFGDPMDRLPDESYYSTWDSPFDFTRIPPVLAAKGRTNETALQHAEKSVN